MAAASLIMLISLSFGIGISLYLLNPINTATLPWFFPRIQTCINQSSALMYRWLLVAASFDRYALSSLNANLRNFAKMQVAYRTILVTIIVSIILPVHNLIFDIRNPVKIGMIYNTTVLYYHSIFTVIVGCILPGLIMIICSFSIHHNLVLKRARHQIMVTQQRRNNIDAKVEARKRDHQVLLLLLIQVIVFLITVTPLMVFHFYNACTLNMHNKSTERLKIEDFAFYCAIICVNLFPTLSFYLYTMTSQMFRSELINLLRVIVNYRCLRHTDRVEPHNNDSNYSLAIVQ